MAELTPEEVVYKFSRDGFISGNLWQRLMASIFLVILQEYRERFK